MYKPEELAQIVRRSASILEIDAEDAGIMEIARRSRGTPRIANRMLKRVRDYAQVRGGGVISLDVAREAIAMKVTSLQSSISIGWQSVLSRLSSSVHPRGDNRRGCRDH